MVARIVITILAMAGVAVMPEDVLPAGSMVRLAFFVAVYLLIGWDVVRNAISGIFHGELFDENFLMVIATLGAFGLAIYEGSGDYSEAVAVILLFQIGECFQGYAINKSRIRIAQLADVQSETEAADAERFITRFARVYTPIVCIVALFVAIVPPLFFPPFEEWIYRSLLFLVISCPCALVISIPLSFFGGIIGASRKGVFIKSCNDLERLAHGESVELVTTESLSQEYARRLSERISRKTLSIVWQNIVFAIGTKLVCLVLGALGIANLWLAVFADTGVMILAVLNALRAMYVRKCG